MEIKQADMYIFYIYQGENQTMNKLFEYMDFFHGTQLIDPINRLIETIFLSFGCSQTLIKY